MHTFIAVYPDTVLTQMDLFLVSRFQQKPTLALPLPLLTGSVDCRVVHEEHGCNKCKEEDIGLSVGDAQIARQDRSMWRIRPSAGQAQQ